MEKNVILAVVAIVVVLVVSAGVISIQPTGAFMLNNEEKVTIGFIGILSGEGSSWGEAAMNGATLAVEEINATGGINGKQLEIDFQDDGADAKNSISAFRFLTSKGINMIIGTTWSNTGLPLVEMANEQEIVMISPSLGKPEFNEGSKFLFNTWPHDEILSAQLADFVFDKGHKKVSLIGSEQIWVKDQTNAFKNRFEELGGEVVVMVEPLPDQTDVGSEATKIANALDATAIVSTTDGILVGAKVGKRVRELGNDLPMFSITIDQVTVDASQGAYEGMEFLTFLTPTKEFEEKFVPRFGRVEIGADTAFDAVMLLAKAMRETNSTDSKVVAEFLNNIKEYNGASGKIVSDGVGGFNKDLVVKKVVDGKIVDIN